MRFDDSLKTILSADMATGFGAQSAWRQLVDLMGRGRIAVDAASIERLRVLRAEVPVAVRAASARALAFAAPDALLVGFFAEDALAIAAPVLRTASLAPEAWLALLPRLTPAGRSVLRHRRDLADSVQRGLQSFGPIDFILPNPDVADETVVAPRPGPSPDARCLPVAELEKPAPAPVMAPPPTPAPAPVTSGPAGPLSETPFLALGDVARGLPFMAEALRHAKLGETPSQATAIGDATAGDDTERFEISDLVARIEAFNRDRSVEAEAAAPAAVEAAMFRYETDAQGVIRMVEGVSRSALIGVSLGSAAKQGEARFDIGAADALGRRSRFSDVLLEVGGLSDAFGAWRLSGEPAFDPASGRFTGFRGTARRPRRDETAAPARASSPVSDSLRQLVHELRTPTNAIAGFAELIETQLLGPVAPTYRERASAIRSQANDLLAAIEDLDTAARIEGGALDLRPTTVPVLPLLDRVVTDLAPLAALRGTHVSVTAPTGDCHVLGDDRAAERLVARLLAALLSAGRPGEQLGIVVRAIGDAITIAFDRPAALTAYPTDVLLSIDADQDGDGAGSDDARGGARGGAGGGAPLLGTGFALRLAQNLAVELGGALTIGADSLTLQLPAASAAGDAAGRTADETR